MKRRILTTILFAPLYLYFMLHGAARMKREVSAWMKVMALPDLGGNFANAIQLMSQLPEFRFILYYRYKVSDYNPIRIFYRPQLMSMSCMDVGPGLIIQHGFGTRIGCAKMGRDCQVWQGVTLGKKKSGMDQPRPIIGNNVKICANALVLGGITIGDNVTIGAASVVLKSVPDNCIVAGNPARIIRKVCTESQMVCVK